MLKTHKGRLELRPMCAADANRIAQEIANPLVHCWLTSVPHPYHRADAFEFIDRFAAKPGFRVIEEAGQPLGMISIEAARSFDADRSDLPELGYWLAQHAWGKGIMTQSARLLIDWFFQFQPDEAIGSGWIQGNARSAHVLTKLGFVATGETLMRHAHFHGKEMPIERVLLTKDHWQSVKPA